MSTNTTNSALDLITKMGLNITTGRSTKEIFEGLEEYFEGIDVEKADLMGMPFMIPKGTSLREKTALGLAVDVIGFVLRDSTTIYVFSLMNALDEPKVISTSNEILPDGSPIQTNRFVSEVFDEVYVDILKEYLPSAVPTIFNHDFKEAVIAEPVILRNLNTDDKDWVKGIITKGIGMSVQAIVANSDKGVAGIKAMANSSGDPLFKGDSKPNLISTISRPMAVEKLSENGVPLDPIMVLSIKEKNHNDNDNSSTLNVVSRTDSILSAGITAGVVYLGPEDPNSVYKNEPRYRSFATQLVVDSVDHGNLPSFGKTLMAIAATTDLTPVSLQKKMFEPESLAVLDLFVESKGAGNGLVTTEEMVQNYDQLFDMMFRPNPVIAVRIVPGTTAAVGDSALLAGREAITRAVAGFFGVAVKDLPTGLRDVEPVISIEHSLLGTFTTDDNEVRSQTNLDSLYVANVCYDDPVTLNRWLLASSGKLSPGVSRYIKEEIIHNITKSRYEVTDVSVVVSLNPTWVNALAIAFSDYFTLESNAHSFTSFDSGYTPYMDMSGYNSFQYSQAPGMSYGGQGAAGGGYYTRYPQGTTAYWG